MKPDKLSVYKLFEPHRRYLVPLYQRPYVWNREAHWEPLWEDIRRKATDALLQSPKRPHFLGAVVLNQIPRQSREIDKSEIIDGQQRLTTLQLFLLAFRHLARAEGDKDLQDEVNCLTVNKRLAGRDREQFKVWPTRSDQEVFMKIMSTTSSEDLRERFPQAKEKEQPRLLQAYHYFSKAIAAFLRDELQAAGVAANTRPSRSERLRGLHAALRDHLELVVIDLEADDDPQIIFETLNARGVPLLPSDLIRNFLLQQTRITGEDMDQLYHAWWKEFDERSAEQPRAEDDFFWKRDHRQGRLFRPRLDIFFFHYLQHKTSTEVNIGRLFREFCIWFDDRPDGSVGTALEDIHQHSKVFSTFLVPERKTRAGLFLHRLLLLDTSTVYPLLLSILGPDGGHLSREETEAILLDLESFLVRRTICRLTSSNYNKLFLALLRQVKEAGRPSLDVIRARLLASEEEIGRWPKDDELTRRWLDSPAYGYLRRDRVQMILEAVEAQLHTRRQERLALDGNISLEHVMPRKWLTHWPLIVDPSTVNEDGESAEQRRWRLLNTFGNLTLLTQSLNSEVSNGPYEKKRRAITQQSVLRLNAHFQTADHWDEEAIVQRGTELARIACEVWPYPEG